MDGDEHSQLSGLKPTLHFFSGKCILVNSDYTESLASDFRTMQDQVLGAKYNHKTGECIVDDLFSCCLGRNILLPTKTIISRGINNTKW